MNAQQRELLAQAGVGVEQYDEIINSMYDAALDSLSLGRAMRLMRNLFQANYVTLILRVSEDTVMAPMIVSGEVAGVDDPRGAVTYLTYQNEGAPFNAIEPDVVFTIEDLMSPAEWSSSTYYLMYCHPYDTFHMLGVNIATPEGGTLRFRINRPKTAPAFSEADRALCDLLVPHLRRAMHIYSRLDRTASMGMLYSQAISRLSVATMVLDESGKVLEYNPVASEILESNDGLKLVGGRLEATYPSDNRELQRVLRSAFAGQNAEGESSTVAISISRPSGQVNFGVVVESVPSHDVADSKARPAAVVYIRDAAGKSLANTMVTKQLFNLTPAETALALELANGLSLEEAAEELNIRRNTARAHLRSIFSKTGVRRQTELVRIMLNSVMALGSSPSVYECSVPRPQLATPVKRSA
ncbi:ATP-dependent transcriptional regulator [Streptococcus pneumoniae]|jgi:DNA-binding CsgD family transcriptional regulator/PAS domain-containing protein|uniref:Helix-turn-helix transcriptional regulator n=1 Tax=Stutzerimonas stutzeri TaxID=316 RepID=A0AA40RW89_STUST|nr:helix-turn-helix transcriptional regulator [Stutzerimonas stutzeri]CJL66795.1 ATP-dependent transcriptional regulator [Streptococcus pneumoniae]HAJ85877.1 LuxR family transcriptional regulator [Pseudomonas sp.]MBA1306555.1 helix-turn-helix transcriptional regulator [Stutzerimonas stutzeri]MCQ4226029.1 helix-turn-helix transcriptional regulator [Stutzerimonas stutzeri]MDH0444488.1 helix-turn-helix transcriptional regulator [Stutzerimonas stutzeri]